MKKLNFCKSALLSSCLLFAVVLANQAMADSSVWAVTANTSTGTTTVYIGGTVHLLRPSDYPLPEEFEQAYQAATEIYFETDLNSMNDLSVQAQLLKELTYNDERSLKTVLNDEAYNALSDYAAGIGMPLLMLEKFKPGMVISTFQVFEFLRMGFTPQGVDAFFNTRAISDGKSLGQLETIEEQIGFLAAMGEGNESEFVLLSLSDLNEIGDLMDDMIQAWRDGDNDQLSDLFVADMAEQAPALYESLLLERNRNWLPQIEQMLQDDDIEFVLVGAAHLVGNDGVLRMLEDKGYQVRQL